ERISRYPLSSAPKTPTQGACSITIERGRRLALGTALLHWPVLPRPQLAGFQVSTEGIGQCFDHVVISNRPYVQIFEEILAGRRRQRVWERMPLLPRLFGRLLINTLRPD